MVYLYILHSNKFNKYYVGISKTPLDRLDSHNNQDKNAYTSKYRPWQIKAILKVDGTWGDALRIERFIKKQKSRVLIEKLIQTDFTPTGRLARLVRVPYLRD